MNILVYLEDRNGQIRKPSLEAISAAHALGGTVSVAIVAADASALIEQAKSLNVSSVIVASDARLTNYSSRAFGRALAAIAKEAKADVIIIGATGRGKDLAPRVAVRLEAGYVPEITALSIDGGEILATHPVYAGKAQMVMKVTTPIKVFSTRPNLWKAPKDGVTGEPTMQNVAVDWSDADFKEHTKDLVLSQGKLDVAEADIIVSGGRGLRGPENWPLIEDLAQAFGAATGASRAVVDAGWRPHSEQVGQTGKTVSPTLYVAVGISGAVQHLAGMSSAKTIVAINKDENAPIFSIADYGIIGDAFEILPPLTEEIKKLRGH
ncbi:MAG: electron transfer flavoprotein subunit alpha/FixB family protein [Bacteroidota bacterium]|nr:electron transfer flavoprotein subunit alpha/FixB family protein [Bacteroidota bacterium]MDP4231790.1 electron transfer flavoprotein subunit alpha/FixB family protein [Bacteroidota bacterium]MDP4242676.1 electron transfer flavoprotein subunit alpha/FixB family protein [Bacteroidota bacterium]MDP4287127.1 electron transfer flavoprotein subunit alpha/FixB family protein [Bacteroidota bacterium]